MVNLGLVDPIFRALDADLYTRNGSGINVTETLSHVGPTLYMHVQLGDQELATARNA
jgi:hypothetical protein